MAWGRGAGAGSEGAEGVDVDYAPRDRGDRRRRVVVLAIPDIFGAVSGARWHRKKAVKGYGERRSPDLSGRAV